MPQNNNRQQAQFRNNNNNNNNNRRPTNVINNNNNINNANFRATPADARDKLGNEIYPGCNGTVCLPVAQLCAQRKQKRESMSLSNLLSEQCVLGIALLMFLFEFILNTFYSFCLFLVSIK